MKLTTGIVALAMTAGMAWGQTPSVIHNTKTALQGTQKPAAPAAPAKPAAATPSGAPAKATPVMTTAPAKSAAPAKTSSPAVTKTAVAPKAAPAKTVVAAKPVAVAAPAKPAAPANPEAPQAAAQPEKKWSMTGKRDPFVSPVVSRQSGSGCSTGKKCLDIEQIALRGVVRSDAGMIAVVTNGLNKAYFLRENDPVFNGYVVKITGDSVVFKETFQDKLGKPFTKDIVKKITTPAV